MASIAPSERLRRELEDVIDGAGEAEDPIEAIGRLGARLILQQALEEELSDFLGRGRYERRGQPLAHRNGYEPVTVKATAGRLALERPRLRNASALGFASAIVGKGVARTHALEALVISSFLRGLCVRDVEAALEEAFEEPIVSKSTVSRICAQTRERYRAWCQRRLDQHDLVYCFLDAIYLKLRPDETPAEGVLVAWGVTLEGRKVLLGLQLGSRESLRGLARLRARPRRARDALAGTAHRRRRSRPLEGGTRAVAAGARAALHRARAQECDEEAARAAAPRAEGSLLADPRRGRIGGRGESRAARARRRLSRRLPLGDGGDRARARGARLPSALPQRAPQADPQHQLARADLRRGQAADEGDRPLPRRDLGALPDLAVLELSSRGWRGVVMTPRSVAEIKRLRRALAADRQPDDEAQEEVVAA